MSRDPERAATQFFGGRVCLDFGNTLDWRTSKDPQELLPDYAAFLAWSARRGTLSAPAIARLRGQSVERDEVTKAVMADAYSLRREIWRTAEALRAGNRPDLKIVNRMLSGLPGQPKLIPHGGIFVHDLQGSELREPIWPVLWSLTALLASSDATRIGCCNAEGCGWFFVDESPNRTRLWCSSEVCGNRERARRAYEKRRLTR